MKPVALLLEPEEVGVILSSLISMSQSLPDSELAPELTSALNKVTKLYSEMKLAASKL